MQRVSDCCGAYTYQVVWYKSIDTAGQEKQYVSWICSECKDTCGVVKIASPVEEKEVKDD